MDFSSTSTEQHTMKNTTTLHRMARHIALLLPLAFATGASAQLTITAASMPQSGDACSYSYSGPSSIAAWDINSTIWDLGGYTFISGWEAAYASAATAPDASAFPTADVVRTVSPGMYSFLDITAPEMNELGTTTDGNGVVITYTDPYNWMVFPASPGSAWVDTYAYVNTGDPTVFTGISHFSVHGPVSLLTPTGAIGDLLLIHHVDSLTTPFALQVQEIISIRSPDVPCDLARINIVRLFAGGVLTQADQYINLLTSLVTGVPEASAALGLSIHPNPASDRICIRSVQDLHGALTTVFDATGRSVLQDRISGPESVLAVDDLPDGFYVLGVLTSDGVRASQRFVVRH
jgi:hypothetical protein